MKMKKGLLLVLVILLSFSVCGFVFAGGEQEAAGETTEGSEEAGTIEFYVHNHPPLITYMEKMIAEFNEQNDGKDVIMRHFPSPEMRKKVLIAITGGTPPAFFELFNADFVTMYSRDLISPLDYEAMGYSSQQAWEDEWFSKALNAVKREDKVYAVPLYGNPFSLFVNRDHFAEAGLDWQNDAPNNWQELITVAKQLTNYDDQGRLIQKGFDLPFNHGPHWWGIIWVPILRQYGGQVITDDGNRAALNSEAGLKALTLFRDIVHKHEITDPAVSVSDSVNVNQDFIDGKTSMWISGTWAIGTFEGTDIIDTYGVIPLPQANPSDPHSILGGWWTFVCNKAPKADQEQAWKFVQHYVDDPGGQLDNVGLVMPKKSLLESEAWDNFPYHDAFAEDLAAGEWPYHSRASAEIEDAIDKMIDKVCMSDADPKAALAEAEEKINEALESSK
jgi:multiple sugar transport system substrate-binding protein